MVQEGIMSLLSPWPFFHIYHLDRAICIWIEPALKFWVYVLPVINKEVPGTAVGCRSWYPHFPKDAFLTDLVVLRWPISCASESKSTFPVGSISFQMRMRDRQDQHSWDANIELLSSHHSLPPIFILVHFPSLYLFKHETLFRFGEKIKCEVLLLFHLFRWPSPLWG